MSKRRPSPWVPMSVYYYDDAALMEAGEFAEVMFLRMTAYAGRHRDWNGRLPRQVVLSRLGLFALENVPESAPETRLDRLRDSGLVSVQDGWVQINGWLKWNEPGEKVEAERERDRGRKNAPARADAYHAPEPAPEEDRESAPDSRTSSGTVSGAQDKKREELKDLSAKRGRFDEFWKVMPKRGKHSNPKEPARRKWDDLVRTVDPQAIIDGAQRLAELRDGEDPQHTPQALTWLNQRRWEDDAPEDAAKPARADLFSAPAAPEDMPHSLFVRWNRAHFDAFKRGEQGPADWRELEAS